jgi:hypothetical protein
MFFIIYYLGAQARDRFPGQLAEMSVFRQNDALLLNFRFERVAANSFIQAARV